jgi:hypothetical protein
MIRSDDILKLFLADVENLTFKVKELEGSKD